jgi:1,2-diacylglycerol 3-alpha-glucosyltransferase
MTMNPLCLFFERMGPYHHARLNAVGSVWPTLGVELFGGTFPAASSKRFTRRSLFSVGDETPHRSRDVARAVDQVLDENGPAAVAIPGWSHFIALAALSWCLRSNRPAIVMSDSQSSDATRRWPGELIKKSIVGLCSSGLVAGRTHVAYLEKLGMSRERIFTGYDVVDNAYFERQSDRARQDSVPLRMRLGLPEKYFLACARFIPKKNLHRLIDAYYGYRELLGRSAWKLVLLGDGPLKRQLHTHIKQLGLADDVLLPGFRDYAELPAYYGLAGAFVHASTTEQWGLVVNEAMASGLPVLVSDRCGCATELVSAGKNGFTFDPFHTPTLIRLLRRISESDCDRIAMGNASREIIRRWSPQLFAANLKKAAEIALESPRCKNGACDRFLLWSLMQRSVT